jgi:beta-glucanase (GH16 family)
MKTHMYYLIGLAVASAGFTVRASEPSTPVPPGYHLVWSDDFNGNSLDTNKWEYRTGKRLLSFQRPENVYVTNGLLCLALKKEDIEGSHYTAGGVISRKLFKYGYYEARFRCPAAAGWHTSFWTIDTKSQEIDICEQDGVNPRSYSAGVIDWSGQSGKQTVGFGRKFYRDTADFATGFHVWGCEFTPTVVKFYLDGKMTHQTNATKFPHGDQSIWLTCVAALWGDPVKPKTVDNSKLPALAEFDWVRYYKE